MKVNCCDGTSCPMISKITETSKVFVSGLGFTSTLKF
jgi:hypothetical protein